MTNNFANEICPEDDSAPWLDVALKQAYPATWERVCAHWGAAQNKTQEDIAAVIGLTWVHPERLAAIELEHARGILNDYKKIMEAAGALLEGKGI